MKNGVEEYILKLPDEEKILIMNGYEQLTKTGVIGDEPIRIHGEALMKELGLEGACTISLWMSQIAMECFRYFAWKALKRFPQDEFDWDVKF